VASFQVGRRRLIVLLLLTAVLLVTLDLRGNPVFDAARTGANYVVAPFQTAARVVTQPVVDAWRGVTRYDELVAENERLQEQIDAQRGAEIAARNAIVENQQLLALNELDSLSGLPTVTARFIGEGPSNIDQVIEIDRGGNSGIEIGMAVVNEAGLIGKVTRVFPTTSLVMLVTDPDYAVEVKVLAGVEPVGDATTPSTVPSGLAVGDVTTTTSTTSTTSTTTTTVPGSVPTATTPGTSEPDSSVPDDEATAGSVAGSVTTTTARPAQIETGVLTGQGADRLPQVAFISDSPSLGLVRPGDAVSTTGGRFSLAPPNIPVGFVSNVIRDPGAEGTRLEIELSANLSQLTFVRVVLYKPIAEVGS
jgi:rod shape-determining protein MreC